MYIEEIVEWKFLFFLFFIKFLLPHLSKTLNGVYITSHSWHNYHVRLMKREQ